MDTKLSTSAAKNLRPRLYLSLWTILDRNIPSTQRLLTSSCPVTTWRSVKARNKRINPLRPNNDVSQTSHCNIKSLSVSEVMRIENMITQVQFY